LAFWQAGQADDRMRIWDAPIRLFHWSLVALLGAAWWSAEQGELGWHRIIGYAILALLIFRIAWGLFGSSTARFGNFVRGPAAIISHIRRSDRGAGRLSSVGHNPLGGWSVVAMLLALATQVALGLFAVDIDGIESGPLSYLVSFETGRWAAETHHLLFNILLGLVALHLLAIAYYLLVRRDNLVAPMIRGWRRGGSGVDAPLLASNRLAFGLFAASALTVWLALKLFGQGL